MFLCITLQAIKAQDFSTSGYVVLEPVEPDNHSYAPYDIEANYPDYFKTVISYIESGKVLLALELINTLSQEELNFQDCSRRTALMHAIQNRQEEIGLYLVERMNQEGLIIRDTEWSSTLAYTIYYNMPTVAHAIE